MQMQHSFRHPLATHAALDVLGYRRNGAPIYAIAGGNGEGEGDGAPGTAPTPGSDPATPPAAATPPTGEDGTDWKAMARQWEKRAKENNKAADELEKVRKASMSEQEKAVSEAEAKGRTAAASEYGARLAGAEFRAAAAAAGVDLGEAADLIDTTKFVKDGDVDSAAIKAAVTKLAKLAPAKPSAGRSGTATPPAGNTTAAPERPRSLSQAVGRHFSG